MAFGVMHAAGILALLFLIPLILMYLIKPRPKDYKIPSLMFFLKDVRKQQQQRFYRKLFSDPLFWIQFFVILLLALAIADPWADLPQDVSGENTVIVLDVSASMQAESSGDERFYEAQDRALSLVSDSTTIILAGATPMLALDRGDRSEAKRVLRSVTPSDTTTALGDAIILAGEVLAGEPGRVFVLSDFVSTKGMAPDVAKSVLASKDVVVDFISYYEEGLPNVGIINVAVDEETTSVYVKNYLDTSVTVPLLIDDKQAATLSVAPGSVEPYVFSTFKGTTTIEVDYDDALAVDNKAYVAVPDKDELDVLLVSKGGSRYLKAALLASGVASVKEVEPPVVPTSGYDVYIFANLLGEDIIHGTFDEIVADISASGGSLVFYGQPDMSELTEYLPVELGPRLGEGIVQLHTGSVMTQDVEFGRVTSYWNATVDDGLVMATVNGAPVVVLDQIGKGKVFYYGLEDAESDFKLSPSYPVFWSRMIKHLGGWPEISDVNLRAGDSISLTGSLDFADLTYLDEAGIFTLGGTKLAVNLASEGESSLSGSLEVHDAVDASSYKLTTARREVRQEFLVILCVIGFCLLLFELFFMRRRGVF